MGTEVAGTVDFSGVRYAQCWEDADILLAALDVRPGDVCLSIASAGDNALSLLGRGPAKVVALDLSAAQLACVELRVAAYRALTHPELLELIGSVPSRRRAALYARCRPLLPPSAASFWDARPREIDVGVGGSGKFERYFSLFRNWVLPLVHPRSRVRRLLDRKSPEERLAFYRREWDGWRWRTMFEVFFSRLVMGRLGRDPSFFRYVEGSVGERILERTRHALTSLDPADNPYLQWILTGRHLTALPWALRPQNFDAIRANLDRLECHCLPLEDYLARAGRNSIDKYNLSDIFEYMSADNAALLMEKLADAGRAGGRLAYWNMLVPRSRPDSLAGRLRPLSDLAHRLHRADKAFFYSAFVVEEILG